MSKKSDALDPAFIDAQKRRLLQLKRELTAVNRDQAQESTGDIEARAQEAREYEDDAQHMSELELSGQLGESVDRRLAAIDRALAKIDDGSYGQSELSGDPIGVERLKALPEALLTIKEQEARDAGG